MGLFKKRPGSALPPNTGLVSSTPGGQGYAGRGGSGNGGGRFGGSRSGLGSMTVPMWVLWVLSVVGWWVAFIGQCVGEAGLSEYRLAFFYHVFASYSFHS